jgi:hypothetical protein
MNGAIHRLIGWQVYLEVSHAPFRSEYRMLGCIFASRYAPNPWVQLYKASYGRAGIFIAVESTGGQPFSSSPHSVNLEIPAMPVYP